MALLVRWRYVYIKAFADWTKAPQHSLLAAHLNLTSQGS